MNISAKLPTSSRLFAIARCLVAVPLVSVSLACMIRAGFGLSPFDLLFTGVARSTGLSLGVANVMTSVVVVAVAWVLGQKPGPATLVLAVGVGPFLEVALGVIPQTDHEALRVLLFGLGVLGLAATATVFIGAHLGVGPPEALMLGLMHRGLSLVPARVSYELGALVIGAALGGDVGVGTLVFAVVIGPLIRLGLRLVGSPDSGDKVLTGDSVA